MKQWLYKITAICCAIGFSFCGLPLHAHAEVEDVICPSGVAWKTVYDILHHNWENDDDNEYHPKKDPSYAFTVFQGDHILLTEFHGDIDCEDHIPADETSVYEWGSISKTMVWVSAMQLWEQGKLDLDEDIRHYLPDDFSLHLSYDDPITMLNLMNHEGGFCETTYKPESWEESEILPLGEALQKFQPAQAYRPGEVTSYSNWGASLAGYVIECISGMDYAEYVHQNILTPLGMEHTAVSANHRDNAYVREQWEKLKSYEGKLKFISRDSENENFGDILVFDYECKEKDIYFDIYPCASVTSTLQDLVTYAQAFVNDDHPLFEKQETQDKLLSGSSFYGETEIPSCSHGFETWEFDHVRAVGHSGLTHSCSALMVIDPVSKFGYVTMTNCPENLPTWYTDYVFGKLSPETYGDQNSTTYPINGYYFDTRTNAIGMFQFIMYLGSTYCMDDIKTIYSLGNDLYQQYDPHQGRNATLYGGKIHSDGSRGLKDGFSEAHEIKGYVFKISLLTAFFLCGFIAVFILMIKHKMKKAGKLESSVNSTILTAGQIAKIISVLSAVSLIMVITQRIHRFTKSMGMIIGMIQIICIIVCVIAGITSISMIFSKNTDKSKKFLYGFSAVGNLIMIMTEISFQMYRFWGC